MVSVFDIDTSDRNNILCDFINRYVYEHKIKNHDKSIKRKQKERRQHSKTYNTSNDIMFLNTNNFKTKIMRFKNKPEASVNGCSFYGSTIYTTVSILRDEIGEPVMQANTGEDKINFMWVCELEDGEVFTIYDWKEYRVIDEDETIEFNIGAKTGWESTEAEYALQYL